MSSGVQLHIWYLPVYLGHARLLQQVIGLGEVLASKEPLQPPHICDHPRAC